VIAAPGDRAPLEAAARAEFEEPEAVEASEVRAAALAAAADAWP
jgi:hypothetical protein